VADERCRITVVGERGSVDLAVPARTPIADYVPMLADLCGQEEPDAMPPAWSLAPAGARPFEPGDSLEAVGVLDGETLYLRDVLQGEFDGPVVADIQEQVAEVDDDGTTWNARSRAHTTLALGLLVLVVAAGALGAGGDGAVAPLPAIAAAGFGSALLAWAAGRKSWPLPTALRLSLALAACPILACAGLALPLHGQAASLIAVSITASVGAFAAYLAAPAIATTVLQLICALGMLLVLPLAALRADGVEAAAVVGVVVFGLLGLLPRVAAQIGAQPPGRARPEMEDVDAAVRRVQRLLVFLNALSCLAIGVCLVVLSTSRDWFALGLVLCLSLALLCRAGSSRLRAVVAAVLLAGTVGLVALACQVPGRLLGPDVPGWAGPLAVLVAGAVMVWCGLAMSFRSSLQQVDLADRWSWPVGAAGFFGALSVPLAVGVFGVFQYLIGVGGKL
jgi:type VII secretion integral membrane protein EccD